MSQVKVVRQGEFSLLAEGSAFCSIQAFNGSDEAHPHEGEQCALLSLLFEMLSHPKTSL